MGFWKKVAGVVLGASVFTPIGPITATVACLGAVATVAIKNNSDNTQKEREFAESLEEVLGAAGTTMQIGWDMKNF